MPGVLINEKLLAVRLGIDIAKSPGWEKFKTEHLKDFFYSGIFADVFDRWWQDPILIWWKANFKKGLQVINASDRVTKIKEKFGNDLQLVALVLPENHHYLNFWYTCKISEVPLESGDGFMTIDMPKCIWQELSFISMNYIMSDERDAQKIKAMLGTAV